MRRGLGKVSLPRVHRVRKAGRVHKYHRVTRAPLPAGIPEDHPDFVAAWSAEEAKGYVPRSRSATGTVAAGCEAFMASRAFRDLSDGYRPVIRRHVEAIRTIGEKAKLSDLRNRHVTADLDPLSPSVARSRLKAWRKLGEFWVARGMVQTDPSVTVRARALPKSDGFKEWTHDDLEKYRAHWPIGTPQRLAVELLQWTGARISDAVRLGPGMVRGGILSFSQEKTGGEVFVPWTARAAGMERDRADLLALTSDARHMVYLVTIHGKARSRKAFGQWFSDSARAAGLTGLTAHGLRKYRMNRLAEHGASVLQMQAWVGHTTLSEIEHYTRRASRRTAFQGAEVVNHPGSLQKAPHK